MTTLNDIAPYPQTEDEVTAEAIAKSLAVVALFNVQRTIDLPTGSEWREAVGQAVNLYGLVKLLRILAAHAPDVADETARELWADWDAGDSLGEWLWEWLTEYGIDPERISAIEAQRKAASTEQGS